MALQKQEQQQSKFLQQQSAILSNISQQQSRILSTVNQQNKSIESIKMTVEALQQRCSKITENQLLFNSRMSTLNGLIYSMDHFRIKEINFDLDPESDLEPNSGQPPMEVDNHGLPENRIQATTNSELILE